MLRFIGFWASWRLGWYFLKYCLPASIFFGSSLQPISSSFSVTTISSITSTFRSSISAKSHSLYVPLWSSSSVFFINYLYIHLYSIVRLPIMLLYERVPLKKDRKCLAKELLQNNIFFSTFIPFNYILKENLRGPTDFSIALVGIVAKHLVHTSYVTSNLPPLYVMCPPGSSRSPRGPRGGLILPCFCLNTCQPLTRLFCTARHSNIMAGWINWPSWQAPVLVMLIFFSSTRAELQTNLQLPEFPGDSFCRLKRQEKL